jgi:hypothetical protein
MQATKASAPLFAVAALLAALAARPPRPASVHLRRDLAFALLTALAVAAVFYSSFGTHLAGLRDAFATYAPASGRVAGGSGHEKPWWYYLSLFGWLRSGGLLWQQLTFSTFAVAGAILALVNRTPHLRAAAAYTLIVAVALSLAPYKTPWHAIHFVPGFAILSAGALAAIPLRQLCLAATAAVLALQYSQTNLSSFLRPADARNPYAYVHSSSDVLKFRLLANAALAASPDGTIRVICEEYWPLPWYLRGLPRVGFWSEPPADCDAALVIASGSQSAAVRERLKGQYRESYVGLRPGFLCVVFTRQP